MKSRKSAIKTDLFAAGLHHQKLDQLDDPLLWIGACIDFRLLRKTWVSTKS
jgi:IS5 family transposase